MVCVDKYGLHVVKIRGRPIINLLRVLLHTRRIRRGRWDGHKVVPYHRKYIPGKGGL